MEVKFYYCEKCDCVRFSAKTYSVRRCSTCGKELNKVFIETPLIED